MNNVRVKGTRAKGCWVSHFLKKVSQNIPFQLFTHQTWTTTARVSLLYIFWPLFLPSVKIHSCFWLTKLSETVALFLCTFGEEINMFLMNSKWLFAYIYDILLVGQMTAHDYCLSVILSQLWWICMSEWTFVQLWPLQIWTLAKRNNDVLCLGTEDIIGACYITMFTLLSCYQTANCIALLKICDQSGLYLFIPAYIISFFRVVCRVVPMNGKLMWPYLKTCLKVSSKHAKSRSIFTNFEWPAAIKWDEVQCKKSYGKTTAALFWDSLLSKVCLVSHTVLHTQMNGSWAWSKFKSCISSHLVTSGQLYCVCVDSLKALVPLLTFRYLFLDNLFHCSEVK